MIIYTTFKVIFINIHYLDNIAESVRIADVLWCDTIKVIWSVKQFKINIGDDNDLIFS